MCLITAVKFLNTFLITGLGKTFVAAVVIHNFYRWYPNGKILFMAPTKPLVAQQIRACHDIVGKYLLSSYVFTYYLICSYIT